MAQSYYGPRVPPKINAAHLCMAKKNYVRSESPCLVEHYLTPGCVLVIKRKLQGCYSVLFLCHHVHVLHFNFNRVPLV